MTIVELNDYLINHGYVRDHNRWKKTYKQDRGEIVIEYKLKKSLVQVYSITNGTKIKFMKGRLSKINVNDRNELTGFNINKDNK